MSELGARIRDLRDKRNWSRAELASRSGITASSIEAYEIRGVKPTFQAVAQLAQAFDVDLNAFVDESERLA